MIREIIRTPNKILKMKSEKVTVFDDELDQLIKDMVATIRQTNEQGEHIGVGLAAVQVGVLKRVIIAQAPGGKLQVIVNPTVTSLSPRTTTMVENCLSEPDVYAEVKRNTYIAIVGVDSKGYHHMIGAKGFLARILQHELEHLDGILLEDYVKTGE